MYKVRRLRFKLFKLFKLIVHQFKLLSCTCDFTYREYIGCQHLGLTRSINYRYVPCYNNIYRCKKCKRIYTVIHVLHGDSNYVHANDASLSDYVIYIPTK